MSKKPFGVTQNDFATLLSNSTRILPFTHQAGGRVDRDIRGVSQIFVGCAEFNPSGDCLANAARITQEDTGKPLPGSLENERVVSGDIPREILPGGLEHIQGELRELSCKPANGWTVPNDCSTVLYCFSADKVGEGWNEQGRSAENMASSNPHQGELSAAGRIEEKAHSAVLQ